MVWIYTQQLPMDFILRILESDPSKRCGNLRHDMRDVFTRGRMGEVGGEGDYGTVYAD
jgi:hypothetical protein